MKDQIFYDRVTGKVITDLVIQSLETQDPSILKGVKIGLIKDPKLAHIENGYVRNMPSKEPVLEWDPITHTSKVVAPDPRFIEKTVQKSNVTSADNIDLAVDFILAEQKKKDEATFRRETDAGIDLIFNPRPQSQLQVMPVQNRPRRDYTPEQKKQIYQHARNKSRPPQKQSQNRDRKVFKLYPRDLLVGLLALIMGISMTLAGVFVDQIIDDKNNLEQASYIMSQVHEQIKIEDGAILAKDVDELDLTPLQSSTFGSGDNFYFKHNLLAQNILDLPPEAFDSYVYLTYEEMGVNRENAAIDNMDVFIQQLAASADPETHAIAYARANGCNTFEDYLVKNGWVNAQGEPDVEAFVKYGKNEIVTKMPFLKAWLAARGVMIDAPAPVDTVPTDEEPTMGGRK